jgi:hypothetical protein
VRRGAPAPGSCRCLAVTGSARRCGPASSRSCRCWTMTSSRNSCSRVWGLPRRRCPTMRNLTSRSSSGMARGRFRHPTLRHRVLRRARRPWAQDSSGAGGGEVGCAEIWAASRTEGNTVAAAATATGGVRPGPANIAPVTSTAPTPGARDQTTTRGTARSGGRLLDGTDTTHPHVGQVRTRPRRKIKKTGRHYLAERGGRSGRTRAPPCCSTARGSSAPRPDPIGNRGATHAVASPKRQALRYVRSGARRSPASAAGD